MQHPARAVDEPAAASWASQAANANGVAVNTYMLEAFQPPSIHFQVVRPTHLQQGTLLRYVDETLTTDEPLCVVEHKDGEWQIPCKLLRQVIGLECM